MSSPSLARASSPTVCCMAAFMAVRWADVPGSRTVSIG